MTKCESCVFYQYDENYDDYVCDMDLDEDEMVHFLSSQTDSCPYWRPGDNGIYVIEGWRIVERCIRQ